MSIDLKSLPVFKKGSVWLVGAGPGDPGLLTLLAAHALAGADVVVYDALVDNSCLELANPNAELEYAGKRGGRPSHHQRDISLRLVDLAKEGKRVLRLKGGDPFVFGRGAEEALTLVAHAVPFRVVPGITAGIGGLAYAGIPVTHRDTNQVVTFLTGHDQNGLVPDAIDWDSVAKGSPVIVMYMAMKHIGHIAEKLMAAGRSPDEPVSFVCSATTENQRVVDADLATAKVECERLNIEPPVIVVIGDVVRMRSGLDWLGALSGRILTDDPLKKRRSDTQK